MSNKENKMENLSAPASSPAPLNSNSAPTPAQAPAHEEVYEDYGMPDLESPFPAAAGNAENPIAVDLASQIQNLAPEVNWTETETLSETEDDESLDIHVDSFADELLVRNLMDLINPHAPSNVLSLINDFANTSAQTSTIDTSPTSYVSDFVGRILSGSATSFSIAPSSTSTSSSSSSTLLNIKSNVFDSLTGAPLPETAKVVNFQDNEVYEVDGLADFLLTMQEVRSPATGRDLTEKEFEKLAETQNAVIKQCLLNTFKSASKTVRSIGSVKTTYFEETIYTMILHCLSICELDQVTNAHSSILDFNKRYFPKTIRSFSGLSLANPTRLLKICSNVLAQLKCVLELADVNDQEKENASSYLYHPVVLQSVCSALIGVCNLSASQYFSSPSPDKYSAKICEVPVARLVQTQAISRIISRRDT
jgi:hypothetical protein